MSNKVINTIGQRIQEARISCSLNQSDLARLLGIKPQAVQHWERGTTQPKTTRIHELAEILKVPASWLLFNDNDETFDFKPEELNLNPDEALLIRKYRCMDLHQRKIFNQIAIVLIDTPESKNNLLKPQPKR